MKADDESGAFSGGHSAGCGWRITKPCYDPNFGRRLKTALCFAGCSPTKSQSKVIKFKAEQLYDLSFSLQLMIIKLVLANLTV